MSELVQVGPATLPVQRVELAIGGMTCASCANRIERKLNKLDGVDASVNYATEKAVVSFDEDVDPAELVSQVEAAGYKARLPRPAGRRAGQTRVGVRRPAPGRAVARRQVDVEPARDARAPRHEEDVRVGQIDGRLRT